MADCNAAQIWLLLLLLSTAGCSSFGKKDGDIAYRLPGDAPDRGILAEATDGMLSSVRTAVGMGPSEDAARQSYQEAMAVYREAASANGASRKSGFDAAGKAFSRAATRWPNSSIEEDAMFYRAESAFFADRYPKAESVFSQVVAKYTSTRYIDKISQRRFQIAKYWLDHQQQSNDLAITPNFTSRDRPTFDKFGNAIKLLERIRLDDPTGELADDATMLAATSCLDAGKFYRADELLNDLRRSFPNSKHQYQAHMLSLKTKIKLYQGPQYDPGPLDAAEEIVKQMRRQFPKESRDDMDFLASAYKDIRMNRAIREITRARSRDRRKEYRAARTRYERVAREFADTSLAQEATARLAELQGLPDLPPQRLQVLANAFPSTSEDQPLLATKPGADRR